MVRSKVLALVAIIFLTACGETLPEPRLEFPVVSEEFVKPVEHINTIQPINQEDPKL